MRVNLINCTEGVEDGIFISHRLGGKYTMSKRVEEMSYEELKAERDKLWETFAFPTSQREKDITLELEVRNKRYQVLYREAYKLIGTDREKEVAEILKPCLDDPGNVLRNAALNLVRLVR